MTQVKETIRKSLEKTGGIVKKWGVLLLFGLIILLICCFIWQSIGTEGGAEKFPISLFIIMAAILGALVNQGRKEGKENLKLKYKTWQWIIFFLWKAMVAIVFAFVLHIVFMGGLVSGELFPKFVNDTSTYVNTTEFLTKVDPKTYQDFAKILVWSFIAGYSETFVPNIITKLVTSEQTQNGEETSKRPAT